MERARSAVSSASTELGALAPDGTPAKVALAQAQLDDANWKLEQTVVHAPSDGFVTNLALAKGQRITTLPLKPAMAFVDTSERSLVALIPQTYLRFIQLGQTVEITFKRQPGKVFTGKVNILPSISFQGQAQNTGNVAQASPVKAEPFYVRILPDDDTLFDEFPPGAAATIAIYTDAASVTHKIRKVMIRMSAILNYVNPRL